MVVECEGFLRPLIIDDDWTNLWKRFKNSDEIES